MLRIGELSKRSGASPEHRTQAVFDGVKYMSRAGWRKVEPGDLGPPERPRLLLRAVEALQQSGVSVEDLAEEACIPVNEVRECLTVPGSRTRVTVEPVGIPASDWHRPGVEQSLVPEGTRTSRILRH